MRVGGRKTLGLDYPESLRSISSQGVALQNQEKYDEAEVMHRRALAGREKTLGLDHQDTLNMLKYVTVVVWTSTSLVTYRFLSVSYCFNISAPSPWYSTV